MRNANIYVRPSFHYTYTHTYIYIHINIGYDIKSKYMASRYQSQKPVQIFGKCRVTKDPIFKKTEREPLALKPVRLDNKKPSKKESAQLMTDITIPNPNKRQSCYETPT